MIKVGADPEFFVTKHGRHVSGFNLIPGTKVAPHVVDCGAIQVDGMALEFNIIPATKSKEFVHNINTVLAELRKMVPKEFAFSFKPVANFGWPYIENQPLEARLLGCEPDFNAYSGRKNKAPEIKSPIRTAAGHIHIGWKEPDAINRQHIEECKVLIKQLDLVLGIPSLLLDRNNTRRQMYGKAGAYRPKPYGVEYRVLGNFWLRNNALKVWAFESTVLAVNLLMEGRNLFELHLDTAQIFINHREDFSDDTIRAFIYDHPDFYAPYIALERKMNA